LTYAAQDALSLQVNPARARREAIVRAVLLGAAGISILISVGIVLTLAFEAFDFLQLVSPTKLINIGWFPRRQLFDLLTLFIGSLMIASIAILLAAPVGLLVAAYLAEYASQRTRDIVKPILEVLAGIPSVVLGFWALTFINPNVVQPLFPKAGVFNMLVAGLAVGILITPLVASVSEDAMRAVPRSLKEASYGLGARRVTTVVRVIVPAAISGIAAAMILAISRAVGETMIVAIAAGGTGGSLRTFDIFGQGQTITAAMAALATGSDQVQGGQAAYLSLFFLGLLLFLLTLVLNLAGDAFVRRTRMRY
jgi:phosphate transport system permease protein